MDGKYNLHRLTLRKSDSNEQWRIDLLNKLDRIMLVTYFLYSVDNCEYAQLQRIIVEVLVLQTKTENQTQGNEFQSESTFNRWICQSV